MLSQHIDFSLLKPDASQTQITILCNNALEQNYFAVCIPPYFVKQAHTELANSNTKIATVVGFPIGYYTTAAKLIETEQAIADGADEIDWVFNFSAFKSNHLQIIIAEINQARKLTRTHNKILKIILETGLLVNNELNLLCEICATEGVDFIKTSTGFVKIGAELAKVKYLRSILPPTVQIKASGGIRTVEQAKTFLQAGASRIGTSSLLLDTEEETT